MRDAWLPVVPNLERTGWYHSRGTGQGVAASMKGAPRRLPSGLRVRDVAVHARVLPVIETLRRGPARRRQVEIPPPRRPGWSIWLERERDALAQAIGAGQLAPSQATALFERLYQLTLEFQDDPAAWRDVPAVRLLAQADPDGTSAE